MFTEKEKKLNKYSNQILPHNIDKIKKLIQKVKESNYFKIDGEEISINKGFGTVGELMDLEALAKQFEELGFNVYVSHFYIKINGLKKI